MKRIKVVVTLILCFVILLSSAFSGVRVLHAADTPRRAVIIAMEGSVLVQAAGQATAVQARKGMELKSGDRIITGKDGSCTIRYDDGCTTHIGPNSRVDITNLTRQGADGSNTTILSSQRGTLWNNAKDVMARNSRFEVNTPSAIAAVRGTFFKSIVLPNGDTLFIVLGGGLYISPAGSDEDGGVSPSDEGVFVGGGQQLGVSSGEELPDSAVPLDYDDVDDLTLLYLAQDNPDIFEELIEGAAAQGEKEFLERINQLLEENEDMQENLGDKLETVQQIVTQGTSQPPASPVSSDDDDTPTTIYYTLTVEVNPAGSGTAIVGEDICEASKTYEYAADKQVTLTAQAASGYEFVNWTVDGVKEITGSVLTHTMRGDVTITANFRQIPISNKYTLTVDVIGSGEVEVDGEIYDISEIYEYEKGDPVSLKAVPAEGYEFESWTVDGTVISDASEFTYTMPGSKVKITANFIKKLDYMIKHGGYIPVAIAAELDQIRNEGNYKFGAGTQWEDTYLSGLDKKYVLLADIDLEGGANWQPIGSFNPGDPENNHPFTGTFDGNGKTISNLCINSEGDYIGLFGYVCGGAEEAEIKNVTLFNPIISGGGTVGALAGGAKESAISQITISGGVISGNSSVGALVGELDSSTVSNIQSSANVSGSWSNVGGIIGSSIRSEIEYAVSTGNVSGGDYFTGGIIGWAGNEETILSNSHASGSVSGNHSVGGLVGSFQVGEISGSYATGDVTGQDQQIGGLVGHNSGSIVNTYATGSVSGPDFVGGLVGQNAGTVSYSYAAGSVTVTGEGDCVGGLVGNNFDDDSTVNNSYYDMETTGQEDEGKGQPLDTVSMTQQATYDYFSEILDLEPWDFEGCWEIVEGESYPYLQWQTDNIPYVDKEWTTVGIPGFSEGAADYIDLKVDDYGLPYVAYSDALLGGKATVKVWDEENGWHSLGGPGGFSDGAVSDISLYIDYDDDDGPLPYVAYSDSQGITVRKWMHDGGEYDWHQVGSDLSFGEDPPTNISLHVKWSSPYLAYSSSNKVTVCNLVYDDEWDRVGEVLVSIGEVVTDVDVSLFVEDGECLIPCIAYSDTSQVSVKRLDGEKWSDFCKPDFAGGATDVSLVSLCCFVDGSYLQIPFLAFIDNTGAIHVKYAFENEEEVVWREVGEDGEPISVSSAGSLSFVAIPDGPLLFVAYKDLADEGKAKVKGFVPCFIDELPRWVNIGGAVSEGEADSISMAGFCYYEEYDEIEMEKCKLFVAFKDSDDKITAKEFDFIVGPAPQ